MTCSEIIGRISLFVVSVIFIVSAILLSACTSLATRLLEFADTDQFDTTSIALLGFSIYLAVVASLGICSSFCYSKNSPKQQVYILTLSLIIGAAILAFSRSNFSSGPKALENRLSSLQPLYDWNHKNTSSYEVKNATEIWDLLQSDMECCGVNSPEDWSRFAPKKYPSNIPISCCANQRLVKSSAAHSGTIYDVHEFCDRKIMKVFEGGCSTFMKKTLSSTTTVLIAVICSSLLLDLYFIIDLVFNPSQQDRFNG